MIELNNFSTGYGNRILIEDADVSIPAGQLTALTGRNGSGKSTLLRALAGLNTDYTGEILVNGKNLRSMQPQEQARLLAFVGTQRTRIANLTCHQLVGLGRAPYTDWVGRLTTRDEEAVRMALEAVGMSEYSGRTLNTMSDGECQRVMVARAVSQDTPVILLDEPTSFLDLPNRYELCQLLGRLAHELGKCIIFSTHELDIALRTCDAIAVVDNSRLEVMSPANAKERIEQVFGIEII